MSDNNLFATSQSAYRQYHSTETALLRACNDILRALDNSGGEVILVLLDLTAAFDTVDHSLLLARLQNRFGVGGKVIDWFTSYLNMRKQFIDLGSSVSSPGVLEWGVPQGSICGPILFTSYIAPLEDIISAHGLSCITYADDTQLYITIESGRHSIAIEKVESCIRDVKSWMSSNYLKLNDEKTEVLHFKSRFAKGDQIQHITAAGAQVDVVSSARDLGVILDSHMTMLPQINNTCRSAWLAIKKISSIRRYLDQRTTERLVHAFVTSRLDQCNSILFGLPSRDISKLQRVQNSAARLISFAKKSDHITPILHELHWLPVAQRIEFKVLLQTYKCLTNVAPSYLSELIDRYAPGRSLRSSSQNLLRVPVARSKTYGERAFSIMAPKVWNALPLHIKNAVSVTQFKSAIKKYLFRVAFPL